jgi:hypothetical protein
MQVIADPQTPPHLFFLGLRAPAGGAGPAGISERVGVIVLKQTIQLDGTVDGRNGILQTDVPYPTSVDMEPIQIESDLSSTKPELDIVVVRNALDVGSIFGVVRINRMVGTDAVINLFSFGWQPRRSAPRIGLAGINLDNFIPNGNNLPDSFSNAFFNGGFATGNSHLAAQDVVEFEEGAFVGSTGTTYVLQIPGAPTLAITQDSQPVSPPVTIDLGVDTVVFDWLAQEFLVTWRGVFLWEPRLELANLEAT